MSLVSDSDSDLLSENYVLDSLINLKSQKKIEKPIKQEIIIIFSDEEELPSVDTLLANISKKRKITLISKDLEESQTKLQKMERAERKNLMFVYNRFYQFFPGYYRYQGYEIIFEHILNHYVNSIEYDRDKCDLINEVFISEIGIFLIMEDFKVDHDLANEIRINSAEYGFENFY
ncbi:17645_t:CDS:2, partial [Cetraspora pellucida]